MKYFLRLLCIISALFLSLFGFSGCFSRNVDLYDVQVPEQDLYGVPSASTKLRDQIDNIENVVAVENETSGDNSSSVNTEEN